MWGDLSEYFDPEVGHALHEWARHRGSTVRLPAEPWSRSGFSGALIAAIVVESHGRAGRLGAQKMLVKVSPPAADPESARHHDAWNFNPTFAERRLVPQIESAYPVGDGRVLTFQAITGSLSNAKGPDQLPPKHRSLVYSTVLRIVLDEWNSITIGDDAGPALTGGTVGSLLAEELGGRHDEATRWSRDNNVAVHALSDGLADPVRLLVDSPSRALRIDYLAGPSHGDLHSGNVLVPCTESGDPELDDIRLIDLAGFAPRAPLSRDIAALTISLARSFVVPSNDENAQGELIDLIIDPQGGSTHTLPPWVADTVMAVAVETKRWIPTNWTDEWRTQRHLSLIAHAMLATSFDNVPDAAKLWFFKLAARLTRMLPFDVEAAGHETPPVSHEKQDPHVPGPMSPPTSDPTYRTEIHENHGAIAIGHGATAIKHIGREGQ